MMKCLVIGYGSIGRRHAEVLREMGCSVAAVTKRADADIPAYAELAEALDRHAPEYVVIANDTGLHGETLARLAGCGYAGITLVEKPMLADANEPLECPAGPVYIGYTLRFHPVLGGLFERLKGQSLWSLSAYVGQFLPDWRPQRDYRSSYSARRMDGGVVRDLSHELDYAQWLAGRWLSTVASGGHLSALEIESEDAVTVLARTERCELVTIHMNYLDRIASRWVLANGCFGTIRADLVRGTLDVNGAETRFALDRNQMIRAQHAATMAGNDARSCGVPEGMSTVRWVEAIHRSIEQRRWVDELSGFQDAIRSMR
jgi:predicted dehydrogenase